jgi:hypothetical protein
LRLADDVSPNLIRVDRVGVRQEADDDDERHHHQRSPKAGSRALSFAQLEVEPTRNSAMATASTSATSFGKSTENPM